MNQGGNISTNTNNTSNDIMRAMKSAYTSLSTLLEQDALAKYDISDAFINFFRDASINKKTIHDLEAIRSTISSVSPRVFDESLFSEGTSADSLEDSARQASLASGFGRQPESRAAPEPPAQTPRTHDSPRGAAEIQLTGSAAETKLSGRKRLKRPGNPGGRERKGMIAGGVGLLVLVLTFLLVSGGSSETVTDRKYTLCTGLAGTYTGEWKDGRPEGRGTISLENGGVYEGEWKDGEANGQGTIIWSSGAVYKGEWKDSQKNGQGTMVYETGDKYEGEWAGDNRNGRGTFTYSDGSVESGVWKDGKLIE